MTTSHAAVAPTAPARESSRRPAGAAMTAATDTSTIDRFVESIRRVPLDAVLLVAVLAVANLAFASAPGPAVRLLVGLPVLFVLPGYALLTWLFPRRAPPGARSLSARLAGRRGALSPGERLALSFGTSLLLLGPLAVGLSVVGVGLSGGSLFAGLSLIVVVGAVGGAVRRVRVPEAERFTLPLAAWLDAFTGDSAGSLAVNFALAVAILLAVSTLAAGLFGADAAETGTDLSLQSPDGAGGTVAADPPPAVERGQSIPLIVGVDNHEGRHHTYTVVAELQRLRDDGSTSTIVQSRRVQHLVLPVEAGETVRERHTVEPSLAGENLRLTYYLYIGPAPDDPTRENAYRTVHVWLDVEP